MVDYVLTRESEPTRSGAPGLAADTPDAAWCGFGEVTVWWRESGEVSLPEPRRTGAAARTEEGQLYLVGQAGNSFLAHFPDARVALNRGRYLAVVLTADEAAEVERESGACFGLRPLPANTDVVRRSGRPDRREPRPEISAFTESVSPDELFASMSELVGFGTRHSLSPQFRAAADWARARLESFGFAVSTTPISVGSGTSLNVVAEKPGTAGAPTLVLATAHLDSVNLGGGPTAPAPGADDNGSGAAGVLEIGRVLADQTFAHDLRLILFGGEEQGLHGSKQYVAALSEFDRSRLEAVINMDMIAVRNVPAPTVLLEGAEVSRSLMDDLAAAARDYTGLVVETSLDPFASDHVPFLEAGLPALLTIEGGDSANVDIHTANDTMDKIDRTLAGEIVRMNVAVLADRLAAGSSVGPSPPVAGPVAVSRAPDRLDVFVVGPDQALYHKTYDGTAWRPGPSSYESLGGACSSTPRVVSWGPDRLDVFAVGADQGLYHKWWDGSGWRPSLTDWENLGGDVAAF